MLMGHNYYSYWHLQEVSGREDMVGGSGEQVEGRKTDMPVLARMMKKWVAYTVGMVNV